MGEPLTRKKVVVLLGSPRKNGNSTVLARQIAKGAKAAGSIVDTVYLNGMNIKACQGCYGCRKKNSSGCVVDDDMQSLYPKLIDSDAWVIASPVYWFTMSAQTKIFMDRCFALLGKEGGPNPFLGKKIAIAMTYGDADPFGSGCVNALRAFQDAYRYVDATIVGMVYGSASNAGEIRSNAELMNDAENLGRQLVEN